MTFEIDTRWKEATIIGLVQQLKSVGNQAKNQAKSILAQAATIIEADLDRELSASQKAQVLEAKSEAQRFLNILTRAKVDEQMEGGFGL